MAMSEASSFEEQMDIFRWFGIPVKQSESTLEEMLERIPYFDKRPFTADEENKNYDVIVRKPINGEGEIPVGIVSKSYSLIQHRDILNFIINSIKDEFLDHEEMKFLFFLTEYGERMELLMRFPSKYHFDPGDGYKVGFSLWLRNSVDGSTKFSAEFGWLRLVCSNGMVIFEKDRFEHRHTKSLDQYYVNEILRNGLALYEKEKRMLIELYRTPLDKNAFEKWVNDSLKEKWGVKAAVRTYHIAMSGKDVTYAPLKKKVPSSQIEVKYTIEVPGAVAPANNLYAVVQALSWLARQRRDIDEQFQWRAQIPALIDDYLKIAA
ncbi:MAG: DUF932 domain-containing protein [Candidatus Schekmanbacteria bacterium]|nr:MAG: DUF932 domain-containing protein [Candidatus Schekmanbacteria bacterium]